MKYGAEGEKAELSWAMYVLLEVVDSALFWDFDTAVVGNIGGMIQNFERVNYSLLFSPVTPLSFPD